MSSQPDPYWERTRYNPNLRRDALYVAQQTGSDAAKGFWGAFLFLCVAFWPSWALRGETRMVVSCAWYGIVGAGVIWFLAAFMAARSRRPRPAKGRLRVEATTPGQLRPPPASVCAPRCLHENAVRVAGAAWPQETLENWCPGCDTQLGAAFRWSCCGAPPGDRPGDGHVHNCPNRKR